MSLNKTTFGPKPKYPEVMDLIYDPGFVKIGGPCSIESPEQVKIILETIYPHITHFRGGVFRAGTYPGDDWGWKMDLLKETFRLTNEFKRPNIVDVLDIRDIEKIDPYCDVFQVGMRQAQHYALLKELGRQNKPVILKRGSWMTLNELLGATEYILQGGNKRVILCERGGISPLDHTRWELSISLIAAVKKYLGIPIIIDASHGTGNKDLVQPLTLSGVAAGANGFLLECHPYPEKSLSDAEQAISLMDYVDLAIKAEEMHEQLF